jgi:hypothetical protein
LVLGRGMLKYYLAVLMIFIGVEVAHGCDVDHVMDSGRLDKLRSHISANDIGKVRVFSRPYGLVTMLPMSPETLEGRWEIPVDPSKYMEYVGALLEEMTKSEICMSPSYRDIAWGIVVYSRDGQRILSLYLERNYFFVPYVRGQIDRAGGVEVPLTLLHWFESRFPPAGFRRR